MSRTYRNECTFIITSTTEAQVAALSATCNGAKFIGDDESNVIPGTGGNDEVAVIENGEFDLTGNAIRYIDGALIPDDLITVTEII